MWVVHGDGFDEITPTGETIVAQLADGTVTNFSVKPEELGLSRHRREDLRGGDAAFNARALRNLLEGAKGAYRDAVLMNAGAGLLVAGKAATLADGAVAAARSIDSGKALAVLDALMRISNE